MDLIRKILLMNILIIWMLITALPPIKLTHFIVYDTLNEDTFKKKNVLVLLPQSAFQEWLT
jgi:hypothetical protein